MNRLWAAAVTCSLVLSAWTSPVAAAGGTPVDCGAGADLQAAIDAADAGARLAIAGTCAGNFVIDKDLTLAKGADGAAIRDGDNNIDGIVLHVLKGASVTVRGLAVTAWVGVAVTNDGRLVLSHVTAKNLGHPAETIHNLGSLKVADSTIDASAWHHATVLNEGRLLVRRTVMTGGSGMEGHVAGIENVVGATATVVDSELHGSSFYRGCILNAGSMSLIGTVISECRTSVGSPIENHGTLSLVGSTVRNNRGGDGDASAGGISNDGVLLVVDSVISRNRFASDAGVDRGAGIHNLDGGLATLIRSVVKGNVTPQRGGGIANEAGADLDLRSVTIRNNAAGVAGGGIHNEGTLTKLKVTFSGNTPNACTGC